MNRVLRLTSRRENIRNYSSLWCWPPSDSFLCNEVTHDHLRFLRALARILIFSIDVSARLKFGDKKEKFEETLSYIIKHCGKLKWKFDYLYTLCDWKFDSVSLRESLVLCHWEIFLISFPIFLKNWRNFWNNREHVGGGSDVCIQIPLLFILAEQMTVVAKF